MRAWVRFLAGAVPAAISCLNCVPSDTVSISAYFFIVSASISATHHLNQFRRQRAVGHGLSSQGRSQHVSWPQVTKSPQVLRNPPRCDVLDSSNK